MMRTLPLRSRLALLAAAGFAVAITVSAAACWFVTGHQLRQQLDESLRTTLVSRGYLKELNSHCTTDGTGSTADASAARPSNIIAQILNSDGTRCIPAGGTGIRLDGSDLTVVQGTSEGVMRDGVMDDRTVVRVLTRHSAQGTTVSIARPLTELNDAMRNLGVILIVVGGLGVLGAAGVGLLIARTALAPVHRLTAAVEHIARTEDLNTRIPVLGNDEVARLSSSFNSMTAALESSRSHQQRLIADAGHELRTPLTSLRANVELLLRSDKTGRPLSAPNRHALLSSLQAQTMELTSLIADLLELSRPAPARAVTDEPTPLHAVVERALRRARLRGPGITFDVLLDPWFVQGEPAALERAVVNLLDNAVKFSPSDGRIEVRLHAGELTVRDHGPGIPSADLPHVFERFWRAPSARSMPGSGLGLSIVAHTVQRAGGEAALHQALGGGTVAHVRLPGAPGGPRSL